jgi:hypothetical protein
VGSPRWDKIADTTTGCGGLGSAFAAPFCLRFFLAFVFVFVGGPWRAVLGKAQECAPEERQLHAGFEGARVVSLVRALLGGPLVDEAAPAKPAGHALLDALGDDRVRLARRRRALVEDERPLLALAQENAIERGMPQRR